MEFVAQVETKIGINLDRFGGDANDKRLIQFIEGLGEIVDASGGVLPKASLEMGIDEAFPVHLMLGIPLSKLTEMQRRFVEAYYGYCFDLPIGETAGIWTTTPRWEPVNPRHQPVRLERAEFDYEFALSLGVRRSVWEQKILISDVLWNKARRGISSRVEILRARLMLAAFGFTKPDQFFIPKEERS